jgi:hypothetical protein
MQPMRWCWAALVLVACAAETGEPEDGGTAGADDGADTQTDDDAGGDGPDPVDDGADASGSQDAGDDGPNDDDDDGPPAGDDGDDGAADGDDTSGPTGDGGPVADPPPTEADALLGWLQAGTYLDWPAESGPHPSAGPHFGTVRTFVDDTLFASLQAGNAEHPVGAAAVKELYGNGDQVRGWSVMVKVALGAGDDGWYWYERYDDSVYGDGVGDGTCTGCHGSGVDYVRSPFPLQ